MIAHLRVSFSEITPVLLLHLCIDSPMQASRRIYQAATTNNTSEIAAEIATVDQEGSGGEGEIGSKTNFTKGSCNTTASPIEKTTSEVTCDCPRPHSARGDLDKVDVHTREDLLIYLNKSSPTRQAKCRGRSAAPAAALSHARPPRRQSPSTVPLGFLPRNVTAVIALWFAANFRVASVPPKNRRLTTLTLVNLSACSFVDLPHEQVDVSGPRLPTFSSHPARHRTTFGGRFLNRS